MKISTESPCVYLVKKKNGVAGFALPGWRKKCVKR